MHWALLSMLSLSAIDAPPTEQRSQAQLDSCSLEGTGNIERCERIYWRSRIIAAALPSYTFATDGRRNFHGLTWNISVDLPRDFWASYFTLGVRAAPAPTGTNPFLLNIGAAFAWFPESGELVGRLALRMRIISLAFPNSPALSVVHLSVGLGGFVNRDGPGPRFELRARIGHLAWGGIAVAVGYQPNISINRHVGDLTLGFEAPWMWWW